MRDSRRKGGERNDGMNASGDGNRKPVCPVNGKQALAICLHRERTRLDAEDGIQGIRRRDDASTSGCVETSSGQSIEGVVQEFIKQGGIATPASVIGNVFQLRQHIGTNIIGAPAMAIGCQALRVRRGNLPVLVGTVSHALHTTGMSSLLHGIASCTATPGGRRRKDQQQQEHRYYRFISH